MTLTNNTPITGAEVRSGLKRVYKSGSGASDPYVKDTLRLSNGFTVIRYRADNVLLNKDYRFRFISPDDFDITCCGMRIRFSAAPTGGNDVDFTCKIDGSTGDFENDLPVDDNLFLTEPITNIEDQPLLAPATGVVNNVMHLKATVGGGIEQHSSRYSSWLFDNNRSCNTFLKGSAYDILLKAHQAAAFTPSNEFIIEVFVTLKTKLRKN